MKRSSVLPSLVLFSVVALSSAVAIAKPSPPNIILIFVDDMGYGDLACYGNTKNKTPNIDQIAAAGQRWTSFYSSGSTCVPSRKGLMSGRHPVFIPRPANGLKEDRSALMPAMLKRQGYATAILGKWHLAGYPKDFTVDPMHPLECGFDYHYGTPGSNDVPPPPGKKQTREVFDTCDKFSFPVPLIRGREVVEFPVNQELLTRRYTQEAVKWIESQKNERFFLYLAHNMPHAPIFASPEFQNRSAGGRFGDVVEEIDWSVGEVVDAVRRSGIEKETLIIFTSDNGPWSCFGPHGGTAGPLRGEKATTWEGGQRVPAIFYWPGTIQPATVDGIAANLDLYATFAALTGGNPPADKPGYVSTDLSPTLLDGAPSPRNTWAYHQNAFRSGRYKIHVASTPPTDPITRRRRPTTRYETPLLFDLESDLGEQTDVASQYPDVVARLLSEMQAFHGSR
ncbi:Arylsulfatase [Stieleria maiorica]|uniref:Arylsulfatase n=1 Tax=Stieleria maiorica TaxID=2795974 RepID=A0A5B9MHR1_9BACT|nr:sulfatase [Stieleria maiorica]QEF99115.1 Arylsulfatase [Stieleria maiorica]